MSDTSVTRVTVTKEKYTQATAAAGIDADHAANLWRELELRRNKIGADMIGFILAGIFLVAGAIITGGWFLDHATAFTTCLASSVLMVGFFFGGQNYHKQADMRIPAGLLFALSVLLVPVVVTSGLATVIAHANGLEGVTFVSSFAALAVGSFLAWRKHISFVVLPGLIAGAVAATTIPGLIESGGGWFHSWDWALIVYGLALNAVFTRIDGKTGDEDFSFWGYFVGVAAFWLGMAMINKGEFGHFLIAVIGFVSICSSAYLDRRIFLIAGAGAIIGYVIHLLSIFTSGVTFGVALLALGILVLPVIAYYRRNADEIDAWLKAHLPTRSKK